MNTFFYVNCLFLKWTCTIFSYNLLGIFLAALRFGMCLQGESQGYYRANLIFLPSLRNHSTVLPIFQYMKTIHIFFLYFICLWWKVKQLSLLFYCWPREKMPHHYNFMWAVGKQYTQETLWQGGNTVINTKHVKHQLWIYYKTNAN